MAHDTTHFKVSEFACKHCDYHIIDQRVIDIAESIRLALSVPIRVN